MIPRPVEWCELVIWCLFKCAGAKGLGAHPGYMQGTGMHVDIIGASQGGGTMWGARGTGKPPARIAQAFQTGRSASQVA